MKKHLFSALALFGFAIGSVGILASTPGIAEAASIGSYIKGSAPTVYWYASNGKRYVFPNSRTFASWEGTSSVTVNTVADVELYTIPIGGNMTYRPGSRLVKIVTDPRVYAVSRYGILRWVSTEAIARELYGENWNKMVDDVPDEFFVNYTVGEPITDHSTPYNPSAEYNTVLTPDQNISTQASTGDTTPTPAPTNMWGGIPYGNDQIPLPTYSPPVVQIPTPTTTTLPNSVAPPVALRVTSVTTAPDPNKPNLCNKGFGAIGTITTDGPGIVTYQWQRSDGAIAPIETTTFAQAGSKTVYEEWFLSGTYTGWLRLHVLTPNVVTSNQTPIVSQCTQPEPAKTTYSFSCGPYMQTYRVTSPDYPDGYGVRCVKWSQLSSARPGIPVFTWYGEGRWGAAHYRHVGQALVMNEEQQNGQSYTGFASDITGNGESTAGNFDGTLTLTPTESGKIRVTGGWTETWEPVTSVALDIEPFSAPQTCGSLFDEYRVESFDRYLASPSQQSQYRQGTGLRCVLKAGLQQTTWYGVGNWDGTSYAHLATYANTGLGATDFCQQSQDYCSNFPYGSIIRRELSIPGTYTVDGWNEIWIPTRQ